MRNKKKNMILVYLLVKPFGLKFNQENKLKIGGFKQKQQREMLLQIEKYNLSKLLENYSFEHLRPPPEVMEITIPEEQLWRDANGQKKRHIFWKVEYTAKQNQAIQYIKTCMHQKRIMENISDQIILKHLYSAKFDYQQTFQRLLKIQQLHTNKIITKLTRQTIRRLQLGFIYSYGFDKEMHPILIVRADKLASTISDCKGDKAKIEMQVLKNFNSVYFLLLIVTNFKMTPYHNEKYITIMDFNDMDFSSIPFLVLFDIFTKMNLYYCSTSHRTFLYNSRGIQNLWNIGKKMVPGYSFKNTIFIEKGKESQILEHISQMELQKKYGGSLENLTKYWPPQSTNSQFDELNLNNLSQETAFYSVENNYQIFYEKEQGICGQQCNCQIY